MMGHAAHDLRQTVQGVFLKSLKLANFRSYDAANMCLSSQKPLVVLQGANGAGKTNILEAISYLAPGRGLRGASLADVNKRGATAPWAVAAIIEQGGEDIRVGTGIDPDGNDTTGNNSRRIVRLNGETIASSSILAHRWSLSWLTPQMDRLFLEGASSRRRFLDRLVMGLYPDHSRQVGAYERLMRDRNRLLTDQGLQADPAWLTALEARMAEHAVAVASCRLDFAGQLAGQLQNRPTGPFPAAQLAIDGWLEEMLAGGTAPVDAEAALTEKLRTDRAQDARAGRTKSGVHKTDLLVTHTGKAMPAGLCSTGEQKALLIALVLANARLLAAQKRQAPLMLLDEVAAHLDQTRRAALFDELTSLGGQCWLTGTDKALFQGTDGAAEFFNVADGEIRPAM